MELHDVQKLITRNKPLKETLSLLQNVRYQSVSSGEALYGSILDKCGKIKVLGLSRLQECPNRPVNVSNRSAWTFYAPLVLKNIFQLHLSSEIGRFRVT